jgi:hypothetical protein
MDGIITHLLAAYLLAPVEGNRRRESCCDRFGVPSVWNRRNGHDGAFVDIRPLRFRRRVELPKESLLSGKTKRWMKWPHARHTQVRCTLKPADDSIAESLCNSSCTDLVCASRNSIGSCGVHRPKEGQSANEEPQSVNAHT